MSWNGDDLDGLFAECDFIAIIQYFTKRRYFPLIFYTETCDTLFDCFGPFPVLVTCFGFYAECLFYELVSEDMVKMEVGIQIMLYSKSLAVDEIPYPILFVLMPYTAIYDYGFITLIP